MARLPYRRLRNVYKKFELSKDDLVRGRPGAEYLNKLRKWMAEMAIALDNGDYKLAAERLITERALNNWLAL